jgi:hypothetical protein
MGKATYTVRVNALKNRLYVALVGYFSLEEMQRCGDETIAATKKLRPGYDVITDITQFKAGSPEVAKDIARVQAHFSKSGARQGVRIVAEGNLLTGIQFRRTGTQVQYNSVNVSSLEAAEELLANLEPRSPQHGIVTGAVQRRTT